MTDTLDETHAQVGLTLLDANPNIPYVFDTVVPNPTPSPALGWVLVYTSVSWPRDGIGTSLNAQQVTITTTINCHCVGTTATAARVVGGQVRDSLLNVRPVIAGRNCSPIKQADSVPPSRDESLGYPVMDAIAVYQFSSTG